MLHDRHTKANASRTIAPTVDRLIAMAQARGWHLTTAEQITSPGNSEAGQ